jgi:hypothetical protein
MAGSEGQAKPAVRSEERPEQGSVVACARADLPGAARNTLLWLLVLTILHVGLACPRLARVPRVVMDESWEATTGWSLAFEGRLRNPVILNRDGIDRAFIQPRVTQSLVLAGVYRLLGFSLIDGRLASVLAGLVATWGVFCLLRAWAAPGVAGLAAVLFIADSQVFLTTRVVRPEIYQLCASVWMLALLARGVARGRLRTCFAAGLVGGIGCYTHPNMVLVILPALPMIFWHLGLRRRAWTVLASYGLGGIVAVLPFAAWVAYAQAHSAVSFFAQLGSWYVQPGEDAGHALVKEYYRWWDYLRLPYRGPWVLVVIASVVAGLFRRNPLHVWGLAQVVGHAVLFPLLIRKGSPYYLVALSPWLAAFVALWASQLWRAAVATGAGPLRRRGLQSVAIGSIALTLAVHMAGNLYVLHRHREADYDGVCRRIAAQIEPGSRVYGNLVFWTGLHDYPYLSELAEWTVRLDEIPEWLLARLQAFDPQYMIRSSDLCWSLGGLGPRRMEINRDAQRSFDEFDRSEARQNVCKDSYLRRRRAVLLDSFETYDFGTIEVYRLRW